MKRVHKDEKPAKPKSVKKAKRSTAAKEKGTGAISKTGKARKKFWDDLPENDKNPHVTKGNVLGIMIDSVLDALKAPLKKKRIPPRRKPK